MYPSLTRFPGDLFATSRGCSAVNVGTTEEAVEIYAFAPGIDPAKIEVSVDKGLLTIAGERVADTPKENDKVSVYARERFVGSFKRVVSLPEDAEAAKVDASYRNGVLRIVIPKREASRPRRIEIKE